MTTDPRFCKVASRSIDDEISTNYACCTDTCSAELEEYVACTFNQELAPAFGLVGCERTPPAGSGDGDDEGGIPMLYIIIGVAVLVLLCCCCCCGCYYRRRRINAAKKNSNGVNVNIDLKSETKNVKDNTTQQQQQQPNQQQQFPGGANSQNSKAVSFVSFSLLSSPIHPFVQSPFNHRPFISLTYSFVLSTLLFYSFYIAFTLIFTIHSPNSGNGPNVRYVGQSSIRCGTAQSCCYDRYDRYGYGGDTHDDATATATATTAAANVPTSTTTTTATGLVRWDG